jgi:hypothetical protein
MGIEGIKPQQGSSMVPWSKSLTLASRDKCDSSGLSVTWTTMCNRNYAITRQRDPNWNHTLTADCPRPAPLHINLRDCFKRRPALLERVAPTMLSRPVCVAGRIVGAFQKRFARSMAILTQDTIHSASVSCPQVFNRFIIAVYLASRHRRSYCHRCLPIPLGSGFLPTLLTRAKWLPERWK